MTTLIFRLAMNYLMTKPFLSFQDVSDIKTLATPVFPLDTVRETAMEALAEAVVVNQV